MNITPLFFFPSFSFLSFLFYALKSILEYPFSSMCDCAKFWRDKQDLVPDSGQLAQWEHQPEM